MGKLRVLDLFSGIGGFSLGLERTGGFETVAFCEIEEFPRKVLAKHWPNIPCFDDVRTLKGSDIGAVDVICGGYPCQPFSTAGKRQGKEDNRHLWPEFMRLVVELRPTWVIGENVAGHVSMGLDDVLSDLEGEGYACRPFIIPACAVGAPHRRDRVWTVGHSDNKGESTRAINDEASILSEPSQRNAANADNILYAGELDARGNPESPRGSKGRDERQGEASQRERLRTEPGASCEDAPHTNGKRQSQSGQPVKRMRGKTEEVGQTDITFDAMGRGIKPTIRRGDHGFSERLDRLKALGNAVVPQIPELIGNAILQSMEAEHGPG